MWSTLRCFRRTASLNHTSAHLRRVSSRGATTIFALSSGHGKCGVAVIRISGPAAGSALARLTARTKPPPARLARLTAFKCPKSGEVLDRGLALWFPGPHSFTGEDCAELQVHGSPAVVAAVVGALTDMEKEGVRPAGPGEFSRRALMAGKMDLAQAEGLGDLIHSETEQQRRQAMRQMDGHLSKTQGRWRQKILRLAAHLEAYIDFSESEEIEDGVLNEVERGVRELIAEFDRQLSDARAGDRLRSGVRVAVVGAPNAGKSSFLNLLAGREAAIVSEAAGTTRDALEAPLDIGGYPVVVVDTAGLRKVDGLDPVEKEGISRAVKNANSSDLVVFVMDAAQTCPQTLSDPQRLRNDAEVACRAFGLEEHCIKDMLLLVNKSDLLAVSPEYDQEHELCLLSCVDPLGADAAVARLSRRVAKLCQTISGDEPQLTRARHAAHLRAAREHLMQYVEAPSGDLALDAQELRLAARQVGYIAGGVSSEQILDAIFLDFCIGK